MSKEKTFSKTISFKITDEKLDREIDTEVEEAKRKFGVRDKSDYFRRLHKLWKMTKKILSLDDGYLGD
jgi:hypothetical protein